MPYLDSFLFPDPLLSDKFFRFEDYSRLSEKGKIPGQYFLDFIEDKARSYLTKEINQENVDEETKKNTIEFLVDRFFSELDIPIKIDLSANRLANDYTRNLLATSKKQWIDTKYNHYKIKLRSDITAFALVNWMCSKFPEESIFSMTDKLVKEDWLDLSLNQERLKNPESYFYKRNGVDRERLILLLVNDNYAIYPSSLELSWVKVEGQKKLILDLIKEESGLSKLKNILSVNKALINLLIQTPNELNLFFENLINFERPSAHVWFKLINLGLRLTRPVDNNAAHLYERHDDIERHSMSNSDAGTFSDRSSETDTASEEELESMETFSEPDIDDAYKQGQDPQLLDFLTKETRNELLDMEIRSVLYADPFLSYKFLDYKNQYQSVNTLETDKVINEKIRSLLYPAYTQDVLPRYYENTHRLEGIALTDDIRSYIEGNPVFRREYSDTLRNIGDWLQANEIRGALKTTDIDSNDASGEEIIENFINRLFDPQHNQYFLNHAGPGVHAIYIKGKKLLESLAVFLKDDRIGEEARKLQMINLLEDDSFGVCAAGCLEKLAKCTDALKRILFPTPGFQGVIVEFIHAQMDQILFKHSSEMDQSAIKDLAEILGGEEALAWEVHARAYLTKQLAKQLDMPFITIADDQVTIIENALRERPLPDQNLQGFKIWRATIRDILDSAKVLLTSSEGITLSNLIKFSWGKITQLTDREIYNYFSQLASELKDSQLFNEYLVDFDMDMHLATYLNSLDIDTIKTKYPAILATELSKELLIQYFQKKAKPEELTLLHRDIYGSRLKEEGKLLFSELYLARLAQEGWMVLDWKDNPRLSDPASYFNEHNNDWIGQSSFLSLTEDYHIYYSNPELSWINIENEGKQFILDVLQRYGVGTLKAALLKTKEDIKVKDIVNTLVQTPQDLNIYFEGTTSAEFLEFSRWLCEDGLDLTNNHNRNHTPKPDDYFSILYQVKDIQFFEEVISYLSLKNRRNFLTSLLEIHPQLKQSIKSALQKSIGDVNGLIDPIWLAGQYRTLLSDFNQLGRYPLAEEMQQQPDPLKISYQKVKHSLDELFRHLSEDKDKQKQLTDSITESSLKLRLSSGEGNIFKALQQQISEYAKKITDFWNGQRKQEYQNRRETLNDNLNTWTQELQTLSKDLNWKEGWDRDLKDHRQLFVRHVDDLVHDGLGSKGSFAHETLRNGINMLITDGILTDFSDISFFNLLDPSFEDGHELPYLWNIKFPECNLQNVLFLGRNNGGMEFYSASLQSTLFVGEFPDLFFEDIKFENSVLANVNMRGSKFIQVTFYKQDLSDANLSDVQFNEVNFVDAILINTDMRDAIFEKVIFGRQDLSKVNLKGATFRNLDLQNAILTHADLSGARFEEVIFGRQDLSKTKLEDTAFENIEFDGVIFGTNDLSTIKLEEVAFKNLNLQDAILTNINMAGVTFEEVIFGRQDLSKIKLKGATFRNLDLQNAILTNADLTNVDMTDVTFEEVIFGRQDLSKIELEGATFRNLDLQNAILTHADLSGARFEEVIFGRQDLSKTKLEDTAFEEIEFDGVIFGTNDLSTLKLNRVVFKNLDLQNAILANADMTGVTFEEVIFGEKDLSQIELEEATFKNLDLQNVILTDADMTGVTFEKVIFGRQDLSKIKLEETTFRNLDLQNAILTNADMTGVTFEEVIFGRQDLSKTTLEAAEFYDVRLGTLKQIFDLYHQGIRDFSLVSPPYFREEDFCADDLLVQSLAESKLSEDLFVALIKIGYRNFLGVDLTKISAQQLRRHTEGIKDLKFSNDQLPERFVYEEGEPSIKRRRLESKKARLGAFATLNKKLHSKPSLAAFRLEAMDQGLYFPSYAKGKLTPPSGECIAITRGFLQSLFLGQEKIFLDNLKVVTEFSERIRLGGPELSKSESHSYEAFNKLLDYFKKDVEGQSSLPKQAIKHTGKKSLQNVMFYLDHLVPSGDYGANLIVGGNHVVSLYWQGESYGYFDSNVAWVSGKGSSTKLGEVLEAAINSAGYEVSEGVQLEVWDVADANKQLARHVNYQSSLSTKIETERSLLAQQDKKNKLILNNGQSISRTLLYDMRARVFTNQDDAVGQLIHSEMTADDLVESIKNGHVSLSARNYLENLNKKSAADIQAIGQATSRMSFVGTQSQVAIAQKIKTLLLSEEGKFLNDRDWNQIVKIAATTISEKSLPNAVSFSKALAHQFTVQAKFPNRWVNAAGSISFLRGLHSTIHAGVVGDKEGFLLGTGEIGYSFLSDAIERGVVRITPKLIKQLKPGIYITRGVAGLLGDVFDVVDLAQSAIALSKAEKGSKEYRDAIAGVTFATASIVSGVVFTALAATGAGTAVGFVIVVGQSIYMASSTVHELRTLYKISDDQSARSFFHALVFLAPPLDVQDKMARDNHIKNTIERLLEHQEFLGDKVGLYATGFGETKRAENGSYYTEAGYGSINLTAKDYIPSEVFCGPYCSEIKVHSLEASIKRGAYRQSCELPLDHRGAFSTRCSNVYVKVNMTRLMDADQRDIVAFFDLKLINQGAIYGALWNNKFQIHGGNLTVTGSANRTNQFSLLDPAFTGKLIGGIGGNNIVDLSQLEADSVVYDARRKGEAWLSLSKKPHTQSNCSYHQGENDQVTLIGSRETAETVYCGDQQSFVNTGGYAQSGKKEGCDTLYDCQTAVIYGGTKIRSHGSTDVWMVKPTPGYAEIHAQGGQLIFSDLGLLDYASMRYSSKKNELYVSIPTQSFLITVFNYLNLETKQSHFSFIDPYQSRIVPLIPLEQTDNSGHVTINSFHLIAIATADNRAEKRWRNNQANSLQAESDIKQKSLSLFYRREKIREIMGLIESKKPEEERQKERLRLFKQCIFDYCFNPDTGRHEEMRLNSNVRNGREATEEKLEKLKRESRSSKRLLKKLHKILNQNYQELDRIKKQREEARLSEGKAKINYETTQKISVLKSELEVLLSEGFLREEVSSKVIFDAWMWTHQKLLEEKVSSLYVELGNKGDIHQYEGGLSPLLLSIPRSGMKEAIFYFISKVKWSFDLAEYYDQMSVSAKNHSVFGILKLEQDEIALMGSQGQDVLPLNANDKVVYAQGGQGMDLYQMINSSPREGFKVITINNRALDGEMDLLQLERVSIPMHQLARTCDLLLSISPLEYLLIKDYFAGKEYQHLAFIDNQKQIYVVDPVFSRSNCSKEESNTSIRVVPFYGAAKHNANHWVTASHWGRYPSLVMNIVDDTLKLYYKGEDLILTGRQNRMDASPVIDTMMTVTLSDFFSDKADRDKTLYTHFNKTAIPLRELAKLAISAEDAEKYLLEELVEVHEVSSEEKWMMIPSTWDATKIHILELEEVRLHTIRVSRTDTDLVLSFENQTITFKDWDAENTTRVDSLHFTELERSLTLNSYDLNQTKQLQDDLDRLHWVSVIDDKVKTFNPLTVARLLYYLAENSLVAGVNPTNSLGFESIEKLQRFCAALSEETILSLTQQICSYHNEASKVLPWIVVRGFLKETDPLIRDKVFGYLMNTTFNTQPLQDPSSTRINLFTRIKLIWEWGYFTHYQENIQNSESYIKLFDDKTMTELSMSLGCNVTVRAQQPNDQSMERLVQDEVLHQVSPISRSSSGWWSLPVSLGAAAGSLVTAGLAYIGIRHLQGRRQQAAPPAALAAVIPLVTISSVKASVEEEFSNSQVIDEREHKSSNRGCDKGSLKSGYNAELQKRVYVHTLESKSTEDSIPKIESKEGSFQPWVNLSSYRGSAPENIILFKWFGSQLFGKPSFFKAMPSSEKCGLSPKDLLRMEVETGIADFKQKYC